MLKGASLYPSSGNCALSTWPSWLTCASMIVQEMHRVTRSGGKLVVLEFSKPTVFPFRQLYNFYFKNILPLIGKLTSKDQRAYEYLYESVQAFPDGERFLTILNQLGYKNTQCKPLTLGICSLYIGYK